MSSEAPINGFPSDFRFISLYTYRKRFVFIDDKTNRILCDALSFHHNKKNVEIAGYVIVPDHAHILARPLGMNIPAFVTNFKTYTGVKIKEARPFSNKVWRRKFFDLPVESPEIFVERLELMHGIPVKKEYAPDPSEYPWSSWADYHGGVGPTSILPQTTMYGMAE